MKHPSLKKEWIQTAQKKQFFCWSIPENFNAFSARPNRLWVFIFSVHWQISSGRWFQKVTLHRKKMHRSMPCGMVNCRMHEKNELMKQFYFYQRFYQINLFFPVHLDLKWPVLLIRFGVKNKLQYFVGNVSLPGCIDRLFPVNKQHGKEPFVWKEVKDGAIFVSEKQCPSGCLSVILPCFRNGRYMIVEELYQIDPLAVTFAQCIHNLGFWGRMRFVVEKTEGHDEYL